MPGPNTRSRARSKRRAAYCVRGSLRRSIVRQRSPPSRRHMLLQPAEDFVVPVFAVARLQHPVAFVREVDEAGFDALALQRREELQALADGNAEVKVVVD